MKKYSLRIVVVSIMLFMLSTLCISTAQASESVRDKVQTMTPIIKTYANRGGTLFQGEDYKNITCTVQDADSFWSDIHTFSIFNSSGSKGQNFNYSENEIISAAYAMYSNFEGNLPAYPDYFYSGNGAARLEGNSVTFMPASPEEQALYLVLCEENHDQSVDAIYLQDWGAYGTGYPENNYYMLVHMVPNKHIDSFDPKYYTIESIKLDRTLTDRQRAGNGQTGDKDLSKFLGFYLLNTTQEEADDVNAGYNPTVMSLYMDGYGHVVRYTGIFYGTLGTSFYNICSYSVNGNDLECAYEAELAWANTMADSGRGSFSLKYDNGKLIEGSDTWYPYEYRGSSSESSSASTSSGESAGSSAGASSSSPYIIPDSGSRYLTVDDLKGLSADQLRLARNEIYARHGRRFKDSGLQAYFDSQSWYSGTIAPDDFNDGAILNEYEIKNGDFILSYEKGEIK